MEQNSSETISISEFFRYTLRHWISSLVIIIAAIVLAVSYVLITPPEYRATASVTVIGTPKQENVSRDIIIGNYVALMTSNRVLSEVEKEQEGLDVVQLRDNMTINRDKSNEIISIEYVSEEPDRAASVIDSTIENFQDAVTEMYGVKDDSVNVLSAPVDSGKPENKSYIKPILFALAGGTVVALVVAFLRFDFEQRKVEKDKEVKYSPIEKEKIDKEVETLEQKRKELEKQIEENTKKLEEKQEELEKKTEEYDKRFSQKAEDNAKKMEQQQKKIDRDAENIRKQKVIADLEAIKAEKLESEARIKEAKSRFANADLTKINKEIATTKKTLEQIKAERMVAEERIEKMKTDITVAELELQKALNEINIKEEKQIARRQSIEKKRAAKLASRVNSDANVRIAQIRANNRINAESSLAKSKPADVKETVEVNSTQPVKPTGPIVYSSGTYVRPNEPTSNSTGAVGDQTTINQRITDNPFSGR